jgi:poly(3-hydroxybutyrate) depolymerase
LIRPFLACASLTAFSLVFACSSTDAPINPGPTGVSGSGSTAGNASTAGNPSTAGNTGTGGSVANTGGGQGMAGGTSAGSGGAAATAGSAAGGLSGGGSGGGSGTAGAGGGAPIGKVRTGMSAGCNKLPPAADSSDKYALHEVEIKGLDPIYLAGGDLEESSGKYNWSLRPYSVRLPANYDPSKPYAVTFGGGGCGGSAQGFASGPGGGLQIAGNGKTIQVGLSYLEGCFHDGGPSIDNRPDTPDEPYFRAVMAQLEASYCIDLSKVFIGGFSSGAWEAYTLGCAASDLVRGIGAHEGGFRTMHPTCKGPVAAVLVAGEADTENPIGPLDPNDPDDKGAINRLGSLGSAPGRDDILKRNGCVGTETEPYPAPYGACVKYKGCPANYPVVWCALPGVGHNSSTYNGTNYSPGPMWDVLGALPPP